MSTIKRLAQKINWEGGIFDLFDYGVSAEEIRAVTSENPEIGQLLAEAKRRYNKAVLASDTLLLALEELGYEVDA